MASNIYNIEMNMLNSSNGYDVLYPKTDYNQLINKPTIPDTSNFVTSPVAIYEGGTGRTNASGAIYALTNGCNTSDMSAGYTNQYFFPVIYNSSGYKVTLSTLITEIGAPIINSNYYTISTSETDVGGGNALTYFPFFTFILWEQGKDLLINNKTYSRGLAIFVQEGGIESNGFNIRAYSLIENINSIISGTSFYIKSQSGTMIVRKVSVDFAK